jgi:hypothetical protein
MTENASSIFNALSNHLKPSLFSSWPGLTPPSTSFLLQHRQDVDARHKAGHDELRQKAPISLAVF